MITLMLAAMMGQDKVGPVLARYEAAMKAMPCFEVKFTYVNLANIPIHGDVVFDRNARLWYHGTGKNADYMLSIDPADGYRELDRFNRVYDQFNYVGDSSVTTSRITGMYQTVPSWLHAPRLQNLVPRTVKYSYSGQITAHNGVTCDRLSATIKDQMGTATLDISVMPSGLVAEYSSHLSSRASGKSAASWSLFDYQKSASYPDSKFANPIPDGFVPYALDQAFGPVPIPSKVSLGPWVDSRSGKSWSPLAGKPQLIVVTGQDSPPSDRAVEASSGWKSSLAAAGVQLVVVSDATSASQAKGLLFDPTQKNIHGLLPPSTPLFVLVDSTGKVRNLWLGFEPGGGSKLLSDIRQAAAAL